MPLDTSTARRWPRESRPPSEHQEAKAEVSAAPVLSITDYALAEIAIAAQASLRAAGIAIALESDGTVVCRARAGEAAPDLGTKVQRGQGITGACLVSGAVIRCADTDSDARVNSDACRQVGVRSLLLVPLRRRSGAAETVGVVEALFSSPAAFDDHAVECLQAVAEQIVCHVYGDPAEDETATSAEPQQAPTAVVEPAPVETTAADPFPTLAGLEKRPARPWAALAVLAGCVVLAGGGFLLSRHGGSAPSAKAPVAVEHPDAWVRLQKAAEAGDPAAQYDLALAFKSGSGMPRNQAEAMKWLRSAAEHGHPEAQYALAQALESGDGLAPNPVDAYTWYVVAGLAGKADDNDVRRLTPGLSPRQLGQVRFNVGETLAAGQALPQDLVAAYVWFALADLAGNRDAKVSLRRVATQLNPQQLADAKARAAEWVNRHSGR